MDTNKKQALPSSPCDSKQSPDQTRASVERMFDRIAPTYDLLNHLLSFGLDIYWRVSLARYLPRRQGLALLDCATGTADQLIALMRRAPSIDRAVGIDLSTSMLERGRIKLKRFSFASRVELQIADLLALPYEASSFDCATISFGIRNVENCAAGLKELYRVLKPGGRLLILEFSLPRSPLLKRAHLFYLRRILPFIGGLISRHREAYRYLNSTIESFPYGQELCRRLEDVGFHRVSTTPLTGGIASIYTADRPI